MTEKIMSLKKFVLLITFTLLLTFTGLASAASGDINLIANPGFESGATVPLNWTLVTQNGNSPIWDNTVSLNGSRSIKISISGTTSIISGYAKSDVIKIEPLQYYTLSAWGKTENVLSNSHAVRIVELDINKNWLRQRNLDFNKGTNDWIQKKIDFQTGSSTAYVYVYANIWNSAGTFWVDDIKLTLNPISNLVANPGFEIGTTNPLNWTMVTNNGNTPIWDSIVYHNGSRSIKISIPGTTSIISGFPKSDIIKVEPLQYYTLSAWGKTENILSNSHSVRIVELDINLKYIQQRNLDFNKGTNGWTQKKIDFPTDSKTAYVYVYANIWNSAGTFWVDEVTLSLNITKFSDGAYYIAKNGNDNNSGTELSPWLTIQKGAKTAVAGDTVYVKAGTYSEQVIFRNSGKPGNYITFQNYSTDIVTVIAPIRLYTGWVPHQGLFHIIGKSYIKIKGFKFTTSGAAARTKSCGGPCTPDAIISTEGGAHEIIIDGNNFYDIDKSAIAAGYLLNGSDPYAAWNITFINNYVYRPTNWSRVELLSFDSVNRPNVSFNTIAYQGNGECIDYKSNTDNGIISHNKISDCWHPINGVPVKWGGIYIDAYDEGVSNNRIFSNIVSNTSGVVVGSERGSLAQNNSFYNNIMYDNVVAFGLSAYSEPGYTVNYKNNSFINNVAYNNNVNYYATISGTGNIFRNNIGWNGTIQLNPSHTQDHNLFGTYNQFGKDPQFVNPAALNFHLKSTSPAIDAGSPDLAPSTDFDGNPRPKGGGHDIGAFEDY